MKIGFVIFNYNTAELTKKLAMKVSNFQIIDAVVIVDNMSTDDSWDILSNISLEKIYVARSEKNGGYSYGNNFGAKICSEMKLDVVFFSNPDIDVDEKDIELIIQGFSEFDSYAVLSGVEYDINKKISKPVIWSRPTYYTDLLSCFVLGRKFLKRKQLKEPKDKGFVINSGIVKGSFFAVRMDYFKIIDGFDENVFLFCEERILSKKIERINRKIGVVTEAKYYHNHSTSINKTYKDRTKQIELLYSSRLYFNSKYVTNNRVKLLLLRLAMNVSLFEYWAYDLLKLIMDKNKNRILKIFSW